MVNEKQIDYTCPMENKKIMLIEDDFDTQFLFTECLRTENYEVVPMEHGKNALAYIELNGTPDLILMDLNTPFLTADEFVAGVRRRSDGKDTPVIIVSGKSDVSEYAQRLKVTGFMKKPFDLDPLLAMISTTLH